LTVIHADHTCFHVEDVGRSTAFYRDHFAASVVWDRVTSAEYLRKLVGYPHATLHAILLSFPNSQHRLELIEYQDTARQPVDNQPANPGTAHICFVVDDVPSMFERLTAAGVRSVSEPVLVDSGPNTGRRAVYMIDPDGFRVELVDHGAVAT
jgi:lactoylglutathione lyase